MERLSAMKLLILGLSITSSWGNGHATVYRGLAKELWRLGVQVTFIEKDVPWYAENRDMVRADYAAIKLYRHSNELEELLAEELARADLVLLGSYFPDGVAVADMVSRRRELGFLFYDIDTPVTLRSFAEGGAAPYLRSDQLPLFDAVLSFTGGPALRELQERWGARAAVPFYCALDPETHRRVNPDERFRCRMEYMGTYSVDRHAAWESLFLRPARRFPEHRFVLAGPQYPSLELPANLRHFQHVAPADHPAFYSSADMTLNLTRGPMVSYGHSPSVRLFEAAGCATCVVSDQWRGLEEVFEIGSEILVADGEEAMVDILQSLSAEQARVIGERARERALRDHTYAVRARQFLEVASRRVG